MGEMKRAYKIFIGKLEGKKPCETPKLRREHKNRMDLREIGWEGVNWIDLAQDRDQWWTLVNTVMNLWVP
jgi:hypothetical protein